ncbi:hypothetical protein WBG78_00190 [Chryseolinea sp. T2]|uniref:hypothetical protein n=1 Tax=Chryseolinea sp. T2 TaxID=3129255 RepID=UPI003077D03B
MPIVSNNSLYKGLSGALGKNIVIKQYRKRGVVIVANYGKKRKSDSDKQIAQQSVFRYATQYATNATAHPQVSAIYAKGIDAVRTSVNAVALKDYLTCPEVREVNLLTYTGAPGELIRVRAWDDFKVMSVSITIAKNDGTIIEEGQALPRGKKGLWRMATTVRNDSVPGTVFTVTATDMAGNKARRIVTIPLAGQAESIKQKHVKIPVISASAILAQMERKSAKSEIESTSGFNKVVYSPVSQAEIDAMLNNRSSVSAPSNDEVGKATDAGTLKGHDAPSLREDPPPG